MAGGCPSATAKAMMDEASSNLAASVTAQAQAALSSLSAPSSTSRSGEVRALLDEASGRAAADAQARATWASTASALAPPPPANANVAAAAGQETVNVQVRVPADATAGSFLQASVKRGDKEYHFSVVVPAGVAPGETVLTVPVPIPLSTPVTSPTASAVKAAAAAPPGASPLGFGSNGGGQGGAMGGQPKLLASPPTSSDRGAGGKGADAVASFLMDRGVEAGEAIEAAGRLISAGLDSPDLVQTCEPLDLSAASGLPDAAVATILSHRNQAVTKGLGWCCACPWDCVVRFVKGLFHVDLNPPELCGGAR